MSGAAVEMAPDGEVKNMGRRLVLIPAPFQGHINPMLQLATLLHSRGFSITILHTQFNSPDPTNHAHFRFVPVPDGLSEELVSSIDAPTLIEVLNTNCKVLFRNQVAHMLSESLGEPMACVIVDSLLYSVRAVAEQLGLPVLILRTISAACFNVFTAFPRLWEKGYLPVQDSQLEVQVTELPPLRMRDLPDYKENPQSMRCLVAQIMEATRVSSGVIINTFNLLEGTELAKVQQALSIPVFPIGPLHRLSPNISSSLLAHDHSCIEWLDKQVPNSVIYVSLGSLACMDENELIETAWGLANSHQPFLWVLRQDSVRGVKQIELPIEFEREIQIRGKIVNWAPQREVLSHPAVGGFWTHSGWNSTLESICEGIPMLCSPSFGDQLVNARFVSHVWNVGIQLENPLEREDIERAIRSLMTEKKGDEIRGKTKNLKENTIRYIQEGGSDDALDKLTSYLLSF